MRLSFLLKLLLFKVKEYCPLVFRNLRERFGIYDEDFLSSLIKCPKPMDAHKSGAKCYLRYIIKSAISGILLKVTLHANIAMPDSQQFQ